jgi:hypothetical protein
MARMYEKPSRFRFGLISLFPLIAAAGVVACFWNPFDRQSAGGSNFELVKLGMTETEVTELIGKPDEVDTYADMTNTRYHPTAENFWIVTYKDGRVYQSLPHRKSSASPVAPAPRLPSPPTLLNPKTTNYRPPVD